MRLLESLSASKIVVTIKTHWAQVTDLCDAAMT
jgi:hypothetical protein